MRTMQWIGVVMVAAYWLGGGVAAGSEDKPHKAETKAHVKAEARVNINDASKAELMKLDGVSAGVAQKIIAYREAHGPFKRAHDLGKVGGVAKDVLEKNAGRIAVK
jgi:competence ComEA-like helix-hairpin-helix protein